MWTDYGYVMASKYRIAVIKSLQSHPKTPKQISHETRINLSHISRTLKELEKRFLVRCINPNAIKGRVYALTEKGQELAKILTENKEDSQ
jgi:DNA-binding HxlR family transcriptional regulator